MQSRSVECPFHGPCSPRMFRMDLSVPKSTNGRYQFLSGHVFHVDIQGNVCLGSKADEPVKNILLKYEAEGSNFVQKSFIRRKWKSHIFSAYCFLH